MAFSNHQERIRQTRSATVLVELVSLLAIIASILSLSAVVLHQAFETHQYALMHLREAEQLQQFVQRWRDDIQLAKQVDLVAEAGTGTVCVMVHNSAQVTYQQLGRTLSREVKVGGSATSSETWVLPDESTFTMRLDRSGHKLVVVASLDFPAGRQVPEIEWIACARQIVVANGLDQSPDPGKSGAQGLAEPEFREPIHSGESSSTVEKSDV